ncbi:Hypothetical Protein FCC1311_055972 [Hondaea fermentalgiana]|uniref:Uncharacterized protein n=1 Tax=Hondaea fermentalgiana TaxID=2315210 RepID=A0A2R5GFM1_9STRA|nr:Hypothetical Protein FCC1311_055972 [Hondaea fermentalgiana]|eukprot:GBG29375.1 Hypothetical Protein FCC1311_055972 [Hondaea fermentalgiana]
MDTASEASVEELDEAKRELLERIKNASNGPEHAKRRIEALDKMVSGLKHRRKVCGEAMDKDRASIAWIDKELERINKQYKPLCERLEDREKTMNSVKKNLELAERTMLQLMSQTKETAVSGLLSNSRFQKKQASNLLRSERGFGVEPSSTFYQRRRK